MGGWGKPPFPTPKEKQREGGIDLELPENLAKRRKLLEWSGWVNREEQAEGKGGKCHQQNKNYPQRTSWRIRF